MKSKMTLIVIAGALFFGPAIAAGYANPRTAYSQKQAFYGAITRNPDGCHGSLPSQTYIIFDENRRANFFLDNENETAKYEGRWVEVTGNLDAADNTIHVEFIKKTPRPRTFALLGK